MRLVEESNRTTKKLFISILLLPIKVIEMPSASLVSSTRLAKAWHRTMLQPPSGIPANQGIQEAQFNLAILYESGRGVKQDYAKASQLYTLAADQGHKNAQLNLGLCYAKGQGCEG